MPLVISACYPIQVKTDRREATEAGTLTPGTVDTLVDILLTTDPGVRRRYGWRLLSDLGDADPRVRWRAAFELACLG